MTASLLARLVFLAGLVAGTMVVAAQPAKEEGTAPKNTAALEGAFAKFALAEQSIGLKRKGVFKIVQEYLPSDLNIVARFGETVRWEVPVESAVILRIQPVGN